MGKNSVKISNLDVEKLLKELNAALSEEWLAYYQYWVGARLMEGPMRSEIEPELLAHADEEREHADLIIERIMQLDGTPVLSPQDWFSHAKCKYEVPTDTYVEKILEQNLGSERCAIQRYQDLADMTSGKDYATHQMVVNILEDELEHEDDIEAWMTDIQTMKEHFMR